MACVFAVFAHRSLLRPPKRSEGGGEGGPGTKPAEYYAFRGTKFRASREEVMAHRVS